MNSMREPVVGHDGWPHWIRMVDSCEGWYGFGCCCGWRSGHTSDLVQARVWFVDHLTEVRKALRRKAKVVRSGVGA